MSPPTFYEFFAGGGMARLGLGNQWSCLLANDIDPKKTDAYSAKFGSGGKCPELRPLNVASLSTKDLPGHADLAWASFPCQDLSLAGAGRGLAGDRSGTFWPFWELIQGLRSQNRSPRIVVLENVVGAITSHQGRDFEAIIRALVKERYRPGAMVLDAARFLPQSRPRLFIVALSEEFDPPRGLTRNGPVSWACTDSLRTAYRNLPEDVQARWLWWNLPEPEDKPGKFSEIIEFNGAPWDPPEKTARLLAMMTDVNRGKIDKAMRLRRSVVGTVYRRTRPDLNGIKVQRAEVRFDEIAGCLRTPAGGSSRQTIIAVSGQSVRTRLLSAREVAKLMGVDPDRYPIPKNYNEAYHLFGDGLAVPVVAWLNKHLLLKLTKTRAVKRAA